MPPPISTDSARSVPPYKLLDLWRGLASLWVVMYHAALVFCVFYPVLLTHPLYTFSRQGHLGVPIFFVLSGYCITHAACAHYRRNHGTRAFLTARCRRIYPPLWCALTLHVLLTLLATVLVMKGVLKSSGMAANSVLHHSVFTILANYTLTAVVLSQPLLMIVTWTLCYEVAFYGLVALALALNARLKQGSEETLLQGLHGLTLISLCILLLTPRHTNPWNPLDLWPQFGLGAAVYDVVQHPRRRIGQIAAVLIGALTLLYIFLRDDPLGVLGSSSRTTYLFSLIFALALIVLHRFDNYLANTKVAKALASLGLISYSLYLTHFIVIGVVSQAITKLRLSERWHPLTFPLLILVAIAFAGLFFRFCEQPFLKSRARRVRNTVHTPAATE